MSPQSQFSVVEQGGLPDQVVSRTWTLTRSKYLLSTSHPTPEALSKVKSPLKHMPSGLLGARVNPGLSH